MTLYSIQFLIARWVRSPTADAGKMTMLKRIHLHLVNFVSFFRAERHYICLLGSSSSYSSLCWLLWKGCFYDAVCISSARLFCMNCQNCIRLNIWYWCTVISPVTIKWCNCFLIFICVNCLVVAIISQACISKLPAGSWVRNLLQIEPHVTFQSCTVAMKYWNFVGQRTIKTFK